MLNSIKITLLVGLLAFVPIFGGKKVLIIGKVKKTLVLFVKKQAGRSVDIYYMSYQGRIAKAILLHNKAPVNMGEFSFPETLVGFKKNKVTFDAVVLPNRLSSAEYFNFFIEFHFLLKPRGFIAFQYNDEKPEEFELAKYWLFQSCFFTFTNDLGRGMITFADR